MLPVFRVVDNKFIIMNNNPALGYSYIKQIDENDCSKVEVLIHGVVHHLEFRNFYEFAKFVGLKFVEYEVISYIRESLKDTTPRPYDAILLDAKKIYSSINADGFVSAMCIFFDINRMAVSKEFIVLSKRSLYHRHTDISKFGKLRAIVIDYENAKSFYR